MRLVRERLGLIVVSELSSTGPPLSENGQRSPRLGDYLRNHSPAIDVDSYF